MRCSAPRNTTTSDWISAETLSKIRVRKEKEKAAVTSSRTRTERSKAQKEYSKNTTNSIRADKKEIHR